MRRDGLERKGAISEGRDKSAWFDSGAPNVSSAGTSFEDARIGNNGMTSA